MATGGQLLLSGLLKEDEADITDVCHALGCNIKRHWNERLDSFMVFLEVPPGFQYELIVTFELLSLPPNFNHPR
jgi:hypothetical protein